MLAPGDPAMSDMDDVLEANASFYRAFAERDMMAMEALWARRAPVGCIHPGWNPLSDRQSVMESWRAILGNEASPRVRCANPNVFLLGGAAFVLCHESLEQGLLVATNIFVREDGRWKMVHHQAGPTAEPPTEPAPVPPASLH